MNKVIHVVRRAALVSRFDAEALLASRHTHLLVIIGDLYSIFMCFAGLLTQPVNQDILEPGEKHKL